MRPVCRFYGLPSAGLDSHFYSASPAECFEVDERFGAEWQIESDNVFQVDLPDTVTGVCAGGGFWGRFCAAAVVLTAAHSTKKESAERRGIGVSDEW